MLETIIWLIILAALVIGGGLWIRKLREESVKCLVDWQSMRNSRDFWYDKHSQLEYQIVEKDKEILCLQTDVGMSERKMKLMDVELCALKVSLRTSEEKLNNFRQSYAEEVFKNANLDSLMN